MDLGVKFYYSVKHDLLGGYEADDNYFDTVQSTIAHLHNKGAEFLKYGKKFCIMAIKSEDIGKDVVDVKVMLRLEFKRGKLSMAL